MSLVNNLGEAFYNSLVYFLRNSADLENDFDDRIYISHPDLNLSNLTLPFILIHSYLEEHDVNVQPDYEGTESRLARFNFTIGVYCQTYSQQRELPELVRRVILSSKVGNKHGIQVYKGFDNNGNPDAGSELVIADIELGSITPLGGETEEDIVRKFRSMIDGYWEVLKDKTKKFINSDS